MEYKLNFIYLFIKFDLFEWSVKVSENFISYKTDISEISSGHSRFLGGRQYTIIFIFFDVFSRNSTFMLTMQSF